MKPAPQSEDAVADLLAVARDLRDKNGGCPWDLEQTHETLAKHLLEEASELVEVIENGGADKNESEFKEELGDVLFQVVIHAQLASERGHFDFYDVSRYVADKLIARHPHVYGEIAADTPEAVLKNWEAIKARERQKKSARTSRLDGVPKNMPALQRADRLGEKASRVGFDWPDAKAEPRLGASTPQGLKTLREKISEELAEFDEAIHEGKERIAEELGDLLFVLAQAGRHLGVDAEGALRGACKKFETRFRHMEQSVSSRIDAGEEITDSQWDTLWQEAKNAERR